MVDDALLARILRAANQAGALPCIGASEAVRDAAGHIVDFRVVYQNDAAVARLPWTFGNAVGKTWREVYEADDVETRIPRMAAMIEAGAYDFRRGAMSPGRVGERFLHDTHIIADGDLLIMVWEWPEDTAAAVTEWGEAEDRYRQLIEAANDGVLIVDSAGVVQLMNNAAAEIFGLAKETVVGKSVHDTLFALTSGADRAHLDHRLVERTTTSARYEIGFTRTDGAARRLFVSSAPHYRPDGAFDSSFILLSDVTDQREQEAALRASDRRLQLTLDQLPAIVVTVDTEMRVTSILGAGLKALNAPPGASIGATVAMHLARNGYSDHPMVENYRRALRGEDVVYEAEFGGRMYRGSVGPLLEPDGTIIGAVSVGYDITDQRLAEAERARLEADLRQAQKMETVGRFAGGLAHDFNNMLTAIGGYAELLTQSLDPQDARYDDAVEITRGVERASAITRQLLAFARRQSVKREAVQVNDVISDMERLLRGLIGVDIDMALDLQPDIPFVEADQSQLEQVILNLALNARDAMHRGGQLTISTGVADVSPEHRRGLARLPAGEYVRLTVRDTGTGMDADTSARAFEPFFSSKPVGEGTGLGLSVVFGIVESHGGRITVDTELGEGTVFTVLLPPALEHPALGSAGHDRSDGSLRGSETVFVVEDDDVLRQLVSRTLHNYGYAVVEADSAKGALDVMTTHIGCDLLVCDVVMPGMSGVEFARYFAADHATTPIVIMSGLADASVVSDLPYPSVVSFLPKPFAPTQLLRVVRHALDRANGAPHRPG